MSALQHALSKVPLSSPPPLSEMDSSPASPASPAEVRSPSPPPIVATPLVSPTCTFTSSTSVSPIPPPSSQVLSLVTGDTTIPSNVGSTIFRPHPSSPICYSTSVNPQALPLSQLGAVSGNRGVKVLGNYLLVEKEEGSSFYRCINIHTNEEFVCRSVKNDPHHRSLVAAHYRVDGHPNINPVREVILGGDHTYLIFPPSTTDLHSYVRTKRRLKEPQARALFKQIVAAVHQAHSKGIVLRDLKLRKFVFTSESRLDLKLESLEDAVVLEDHADDFLSDKHGCPAYVSPEILRCNTRYSGRAADMWGLGVMLYTMLVGRYPFHGQEHSGLFAKIRRGLFSLPDSLSSRAKCLIRCLLRKDPTERLTTEDVLLHPWLTQLSSREKGTSRRSSQDLLDQSVPQCLQPNVAPKRVRGTKRPFDAVSGVLGSGVEIRSAGAVHGTTSADTSGALLAATTPLPPPPPTTTTSTTTTINGGNSTGGDTNSEINI
eukprot:TCALIF_08452-PA protein Name:"Similar to TRIB2 Tribbles homolog 2 (Bos taurus)" AED:0.17 eAED:0.17 QI:0/0.75/0.6/1/0.25/0.4/5/1193/487